MGISTHLQTFKLHSFIRSFTHSHVHLVTDWARIHSVRIPCQVLIQALGTQQKPSSFTLYPHGVYTKVSNKSQISPERVWHGLHMNTGALVRTRTHKFECSSSHRNRLRNFLFNTMRPSVTHWDKVNIVRSPCTVLLVLFLVLAELQCLGTCQSAQHTKYLWLMWTLQDPEGEVSIQQGCTPLSTTVVTHSPRDVVRVPRKPLWWNGMVMAVGVLGKGCLEAVAG